MRILYLVPDINNEGGVARVLSIKADHWIEKYEYEVHILTQNKGSDELFYKFNSKIQLHDITLNGNLISFFWKYLSQLNSKVKAINPDIIVVCDNGLKAYTIPFILKNKSKLIFESHNSKFLELRATRHWLFSKIKYWFRQFGARNYDHFIALSEYSLQEWNLKNGTVIANPNIFFDGKLATLSNKKVIAVGRHVYEKGFDILLPIWKKVIEKYPNWQLDIYGQFDANQTYIKLAKSLKMENNVHFIEPQKNLQEIYANYSFLLMTSRFEGFPMVLLEALSSGLPCIAFDCPVGPRALISNQYNGFLINEGGNEDFVNHIFKVIEDPILHHQLSTNALISIEKFDVNEIMKQWNQLFIKLLNK